MKNTYEKLTKRIAQAEANKLQWRNLLEDCYTHFLPQKNTWDDSTPGEKKDLHLYDSTAQDSLADYANRMESQLVPAGRQWMQLEAGSDIPEDQKISVDQQLEKMTNILFQHINSSNFSSQINECFNDLGVSTGAIIVEAGDGIQSSLRFRSVPLADLILERSQKGIVDTVFRRLKLPAGDIPETFPHIKPIPEGLQKLIDDKPETDVEFTEGTISQANQKGDNFYNFILYDKEKDIIYSNETESSPWVIFRESTTPGEVYGRGRAMRCLNDAKTLNLAMKYYIETCELLGNPIYTAVDDGIINPNTIKIRPKTVIPVSSSDSITPLPIAGSPELNIDLINRLQDSIRRTMMSKPFGQIDETPVRTATEMSIRNADLSQTSLSASGRIQVELLENIVKRSVYLLTQAGKLAEFKVNGKEVKIKFTSPSSRQQDEVDLATTMRFMEIMTQLPPELAQMTVKTEDIPRHIAELLGVSKTLIRTDQEQAQMQAQMAKAQQSTMEQQADPSQTKGQ